MGEIAALAASFLWSFTSMQFTLASRRIGPDRVNRARLILAVCFLSLTHFLQFGQIWPVYAETSRWVWLGLSGTIGLVLGDGCLFRAFVLIGPRRAMLLMTLVPVISALLAWVWMGEATEPLEIGAVLLTVGGVAWTVSERRSGDPEHVPADHQRPAYGILLGIGGALGQALGLVTAKQGLVGEFSSLSAALIRMLVASGVIWLLALVRGRAGTTLRALEDRKAFLFTTGGALMGPFLGVWLSMVAVQNAHMGIASALMSLSPILLIPLEGVVFHERISLRAVAGTAVALTGAAMIFLLE